MFLTQYLNTTARIAVAILALCAVSGLGFCAQSEIVFQADFESGLEGFIIDNTYGVGYGLWHRSSACKVSLGGHTQGAALYYGQDAVCNYDLVIDGQRRANRGMVESPPIDLSRFDAGTIELRFKYYLETELVNCRSVWDPEFGIDTDLATVAISADGLPFSTIARNCWAPGLFEFFSTPDGWVELAFDISDYAGSVIQLQFGFNTVSNSQNYYGGFYVDDIVVYGPSCGFDIAGDANGDCVVDMRDFASVADLVALAQNWLLNCYLTPEDPGCVPE
ncbi:MAG: hypothetical protein ACYSOT_08765 [Planctomycetota bacterium]